MTTQRIDPVWGDDLMAIADAVGIVAPSGRPHPSVPGDLVDLTLALALETWAAEYADEPIPYVLVDHEACSGCGDAICGCEPPCATVEPDACGHKSRPYCAGCAPAYCRDCRPVQGGEL